MAVAKKSVSAARRQVHGVSFGPPFGYYKLKAPPKKPPHEHSDIISTRRRDHSAAHLESSNDRSRVSQKSSHSKPRRQVPEESIEDNRAQELLNLLKQVNNLSPGTVKANK